MLRAVKEGFAAQFPAIRHRGTKHGIPSKTADVKKLTEMYHNAKVHWYIPNQQRGRNLLTGDNCAVDVMTAGAGRLASEPKFSNWWNERMFERATTQIYSTSDGS